MEELKMLVEMVTHLPQMALWVLIGFFAYKVVVVGSIYRLIKFIVGKLHDYYTTPKHTLVHKEVMATIEGVVIGPCDPFITQINRIKGKGLKGGSPYIHRQSVDWLREAINDKIEKDTKSGN